MEKIRAKDTSSEGKWSREVDGKTSQAAIVGVGGRGVDVAIHRAFDGLWVEFM